MSNKFNQWRESVENRLKILGAENISFADDINAINRRLDIIAQSISKQPEQEPKERSRRKVPVPAEGQRWIPAKENSGIAYVIVVRIFLMDTDCALTDESISFDAHYKNGKVRARTCLLKSFRKDYRPESWERNPKPITRVSSIVR